VTHAAGANAGFERPDAELAVLVVSDEPDYSAGDSAAFSAWLEAYKAPPVVPTFHAVVDPNVGVKYLDVAAALGGFTMDHSDADWRADMGDLANRILPVSANVYALAEAPDPATLALEVTEPLGAVVIPALGTDYDYDPVAVAVVFHGNGYVPPAGSTVIASYRALP
jgi:hypothetical protein